MTMITVTALIGSECIRLEIRTITCTAGFGTHSYD